MNILLTLYIHKFIIKKEQALMSSLFKFKNYGFLGFGEPEYPLRYLQHTTIAGKTPNLLAIKYYKVCRGFCQDYISTKRTYIACWLQIPAGFFDA